MKKKATALLACAFAAAMALCLAGCASGGSKSANESKPQDLKIIESGYALDQYGAYNYAVVVENPNKTWAAENIDFSVIAKDENGEVIDTKNDTIVLMFADGKTATSGSFYPAKTPASIEFAVSVPSSKWTQEETTMDEFYENLKVEGLNATKNAYGATTFAGEIVNNTEGAFSLTRINIVLRNAEGSIVGGYFTYANSDVTSNSRQAFSITSIGPAPEYETMEAYVDCGWPISS